MHTLFMTPDLTPGEQKRHKELRLQLADMNKEGNVYMIKKQKNSAEADLSPPCTDNLSFNTPQNLSLQFLQNCFDESPQLSALVVKCQFLVAKKASLLNLLDSHCPDIVFGCESWLESNILSGELFSPATCIMCIVETMTMDMEEFFWHVIIL